MLKKIGLIILMGITLGGCSIVPEKSGVEVVSYPPAKVYINGKDAGMTPYTNKSLLPGEMSIKLVSNLGEWSKTIELNNNITTVVDWEFGKSEAESGGYVLTMEKTGDKEKAGMMVSTVPDKATVMVDGETKDLSPMRIDNINEGDRQISLAYPSYKTINVFVKATNGYKLAIEGKLAKEVVAVPTETASESAELSTNQSNQMVKIKETETGWLRVRETASSSSMEIRKVNTGEEYPLLEEQEDWVKIKLNDHGIEGWVSTKYVEKVSTGN